MNYATQYNFTIIFTLIYLYLILRILVNTKYKNTNVVKEIFLTGFVISIIYVISFTILFISKNPNIITKDNIIPFKSIYYLFMNNNIISNLQYIVDIIYCNDGFVKGEVEKQYIETAKEILIEYNILIRELKS